MGFPAQLDQRDQHFPDEDSISHFAARELQIVLRVIVVASIIAVVLTMVTFYFWVWVPLTLLVAASIGLIVANSIERKTRNERLEAIHQAHRERLAHEIDPESESTVEAQFFAKDAEHFTPLPLLKREWRIGIEIVTCLLLAAGALVALGLIYDLLAWELVAIGAGLVVCYGLLVMAPVWLGWFGDVEEEERLKQRNTRESATG